MLADLDLTVAPGERVLLVGPSGSGKSTLLRAIAGLLLTADVGDLSGRVSIDGREPQLSPGLVGLLFQDPTAGLVARTVGRDVAFGLENTRTPRASMPGLLRRALASASFPYGEQRHTDSLSGGETQRLALAGALALDARVLLLDEPTSMLDEESAVGVCQAVLEWVRASGATLVVVEHRLGPWAAEMDRCLVLDAQGDIVMDGTAAEVLGADPATRRALADRGIWVPGAADPVPLTVDASLLSRHPPVLTVGDRLVVAEGVSVEHRSAFGAAVPSTERRPALVDVSCEVRAGTTLALTGPSGAGKSTLVAALAGLQRVNSGSVRIRPQWTGRRGTSMASLSSRELARRVAWVPQLPGHGLVTGSVLDELMLTTRALGGPEAPARERALALLDVLGLGSLADVNGHRLSGGEQRRLLVAAALVHGPAALMLDEPTVGQDRATWAAVTGLCAAARDTGVGLVLATHDRLALDALTGSGEVVRLEGGRRVGGHP